MLDILPVTVVGYPDILIHNFLRDLDFMNDILKSMIELYHCFTGKVLNNYLNLLLKLR